MTITPDLRGLPQTAARLHLNADKISLRHNRTLTGWFNLWHSCNNFNDNCRLSRLSLGYTLSLFNAHILYNLQWLKIPSVIYILMNVGIIITWTHLCLKKLIYILWIKCVNSLMEKAPCKGIFTISTFIIYSPSRCSEHVWFSFI